MIRRVECRADCRVGSDVGEQTCIIFAGSGEVAYRVVAAACRAAERFAAVDDCCQKFKLRGVAYLVGVGSKIELQSRLIALLIGKFRKVFAVVEVIGTVVVVRHEHKPSCLRIAD